MKKKKIEKEAQVSDTKKWYLIIKGLNEKEKYPLDKLLTIFQDEVSRLIQKNIDPDTEIVFELDEPNEEIKLFNNNTSIVSDEEFKELFEVDPVHKLIFISESEAKKIDPKHAHAGDTIKAEIDLSVMTKSKDPKTIQTLKAIDSSIKQSIKQLQKNMIYEKFSSKVGEPIQVVFSSRNGNGSWNVQIVGEGIPAFLPSQLISAKRHINPGSTHTVIIEHVDQESKLSQITVSLDSPKIVENIIRNNIPEVANGQIELLQTERIPGERTKVLVKSAGILNDDEVYGALLGTDSARIRPILEELNKENNYEKDDFEKLDFIIAPQDPNDKVELIKRAMSPASVVDVVLFKDKYYVIVLKEDLSLAIGKRGSNSTLASKLANTYLNVITTDKADEMQLAYDKSRIDLIRSSARDNANRYNSLKTNKRNSNTLHNPKPMTKLVDNVKLNLAGFDEDVRWYEEHEQGLFGSNQSAGDDFDELLMKHAGDDENWDDEYSDDDEDDFYSEDDNKHDENQKLDIEDYQKAKASLKDFKVDDELSSFGLTDDIDFGEFQDEDDWDAK